MRILHTLIPVVLFAVTAAASDVEGTPPNFVPEMVLSYVDPASGEKISCGQGCRRFEVPDGVELEVQIKVVNHKVAEHIDVRTSGQRGCDAFGLYELHRL